MKVCPKCGKQYADDANFCTTDAGRLVAMSAAAPAAAAQGAAQGGGSSLLGGRFEVREAVGGGATGIVHRAIDTQNGNAPVAVKIIAPAVVSQHAQRVERELKLLEKVNSPAVAKVLASGRHGDALWVASEWVDGGVPVSRVVGEGMEPEKASEIAIAVGNALVEAAKVGVVHRDLAPKNVLVSNGTVKLINFALPLPHERVAGEPAFVSPEVIEGKPVDQRSSTYSLGALFYYLLTGQPPFTGDAQVVHAAHLSGSAVPPSQRAAVAADVDSLVGRAMDRNPAKRYLTLKQFLDDIERLKKGPEGGLGSTAPFGRAGKKREPAPTMLGVGAINEAKTRQMDVQVPPEAMREAAAMEAAANAVAQAPAVVFAEPQFEPPPPQAAPVPAPVPVPAPAPAPTPAAQASVGSSPWAPPSAVPEPVPAPTVKAAPAPAPQPAPKPAAAPQPAAPKGPMNATQSLGGGKKKQDAKEKKAQKGKFRETMWFKKGELDAAAAEAAAQNPEASGGQDKADSLPMEDRYSDDGTITTSDAARYSLKTGHTGAMPAMRDGAPSGQVSERELIGEMKGGNRNLIIVGVILLLIVIGVILAFVV